MPISTNKQNKSYTIQNHSVTILQGRLIPWQHYFNHLFSLELHPYPWNIQSLSIHSPTHCFKGLHHVPIACELFDLNSKLWTIIYSYSRLIHIQNKNYKKLIINNGDISCLQMGDLKVMVWCWVEVPWPVHLPQMFGRFLSCVQWGNDVQALWLCCSLSQHRLTKAQKQAWTHILRGRAWIQ